MNVISWATLAAAGVLVSSGHAQPASEIIAASTPNPGTYTSIWRIDQVSERRTFLAGMPMKSSLRPTTFVVTPEFAFGSSATENIMRVNLLSGATSTLGDPLPWIVAMCPDADWNLVALTNRDYQKAVWRVSATSGQRTLVASINSGTSFFGDTFVVASGNAFFATSNMELFRVNLDTGAVAELPRLPDWTAVLTTSPSGALRAIRVDYWQQGTIFDVNVSTGIATPLVSFQLPLSVYGATFAIGETEAFLNTPNEQLVRIDLSTGLVTQGLVLPANTNAIAMVPYIAADQDGDGVSNAIDNCPTIANPTQSDCNSDGIGDACVIAGGAPDINGNAIPDSCECIPDLFVDGQVNGADLGALLSQWGLASATTASDLNQDGHVNGADLGFLLANWGPCSN
jgi:hypothetical protein